MESTIAVMPGRCCLQNFTTSAQSGPGRSSCTIKALALGNWRNISLASSPLWAVITLNFAVSRTSLRVDSAFSGSGSATTKVGLNMSHTQMRAFLSEMGGTRKPTQQPKGGTSAKTFCEVGTPCFARNETPRWRAAVQIPATFKKKLSSNSPGDFVHG